MDEAKKDFPPGVKVGGQLEVRGDDGEFRRYTVAKIKGDTVHLDGNHPLAGQALRFTCKVTEVRPATADEIAPLEPIDAVPRVLKQTNLMGLPDEATDDPDAT